MNYQIDFIALQKKVVLGMLASIIVITTIVLWGDFNKFCTLILNIDYLYFLVAFFFAVLVYCCRFLKWYIYVNILKVSISFWDNALIFLCGLSMTVTPGKVGEVLKSYLLKKQFGVEFSLTAPTIFGERLTGLIGSFIVCLSSICVLGKSMAYSYYIFAIVMIIVSAFLIFIRNPKIFEIFLQQVEKIKFFQSRINSFRMLYQSALIITRTSVLIYCIFISIIYWLAECMILNCLLKSFGYSFDFYLIMFILTLTAIGGGLSLMPGSVGVLESGLIGLLMYQGLDYTTASGVTLLHRFFAMWMAVIIGVIILFSNLKKFGLR